MSALSASIEPVLNAFFILLVIACICELQELNVFVPFAFSNFISFSSSDAIIGTSLFSDDHPIKFGRFDRYCSAQTVLITGQ